MLAMVFTSQYNFKQVGNSETCVQYTMKFVIVRGKYVCMIKHEKL